jgi:hypothetical protein
MTKQELLKKYEGILTINGMEDISKTILGALSTAYDIGFEEGVKHGLKVTDNIYSQILQNQITS